MSKNTGLSILSIFTLISLVSLIFILFYIDPYSATIWSFILFYLSFLVFLSGIFTLIGYSIRKSFNKNKNLLILFEASFKQGVLISLILTGLLIVQKIW